jgi:hypothetical protein
MNPPLAANLSMRSLKLVNVFWNIRQEINELSCETNYDYIVCEGGITVSDVNCIAVLV